MNKLVALINQFLKDRLNKLGNGPHTKLLPVYQFLKRRVTAAYSLREDNLENIKKQFAEKRGEPWVILEYKRITNPEKTIVPIADTHYVTPKTFRLHCKILSRNAEVVPLVKLLERIFSGETISPGTVAITINCGHLDSYLNGLPLLLEHGLHASWFVPTAYIGSKTLLLDDMIAVSMKLFSHHKTPIGNFQALHEGMMNSLSKTLENGIPTQKSIASFLALYFSVNAENKSLLFSELKQKLAELPSGPPDFEDFMSWNDLEELNKRGFSVLPMLHTHPVISNLTKSALEEEIKNCKRSLESLDITWNPVISAPYGIYSDQSLENLYSAGAASLLASEHPEPIFTQELDSKVPVFARVGMCEANSFSRELFLSRLWELI
ncbi:MAG TPA: polysaccharide deacetylase family protein [Oligoflexia bacterium]|nr:polysaccharide deacetylase family protein [Oligoflexia bacterium]HMP48203.1 polysaccharide deacetylase family protein [Oligoflexia bacterium]